MSGVSIIAMPWAAPDTPSLQVGLLTALATNAKLPVVAHSFHLDAAGFFVGEGMDLAVYEEIAHRWWAVGLGEWIFNVADGQASDLTRYIAYLEDERLPEPVIRAAVRMRELAPAFLQRAADEVVAADPALVGFTTTFSQTIPSLALAAVLKARRPRLAVMFGGANCDGELGRALHRTAGVVDIVVQGEAELVFADVCADVLAGRSPKPKPGVLVRGAANAPCAQPLRPTSLRDRLGDVPTPVYDEYFDRLARSPLYGQLSARVRLVIETSRGCWWGEHHHCKFCGLNGSSMAFGAKPADRVLTEIDELSRRYRRTEFDVVDNILHMKYFEHVLPALAACRRAGHDYRFFYETKANLTPIQIRQLRDAGVLRFQPGIESLSTPILRRMDKGVTALQNIRLLLFAARYDLLPTWNIIYGIPGETDDDYAEMAELVPSLMHLKPPALVRLQVHRFSPYFDKPLDHGLRLLGPAAYYPHLYSVAADELANLAYTFQYEYLDGHDPERAVAPLRGAIDTWDRAWTPGRHRSLRYERGPGFLRIRDRRAGTANRDILLDDVEAKLYLACLAGATPSAAVRLLAADGDVALEPDDVRSFFVELTGHRLMFCEGDQFLALALPLTPDAEPPSHLGDLLSSIPTKWAPTSSSQPAVG
jgi:ribosomal peptide maturation radical SAM protein 1